MTHQPTFARAKPKTDAAMIRKELLLFAQRKGGDVGATLVVALATPGPTSVGQAPQRGRPTHKTYESATRPGRPTKRVQTNPKILYILSIHAISNPSSKLLP